LVNLVNLRIDKVPLSAGIFAADHLRTAAIKAGVRIPEGYRFGLHNLRHSLSNWIPAARHMTRAKDDE
jgi:hypothetical protein